jgi:hypothetical protein
MRAESLGVGVLGIDGQGIRGDVGASDQAAVDSASEQPFAQAAPPFIGAAGKAAQTKTGHRITGKFLRSLSVISVESISAAPSV